jgi:hypothetical protein
MKECIVCTNNCSFPSCIKFAAVTTPAVEQLVQNTSNGDVEAAVDLLKKYSNSVRYSAERHALLFYASCTGDAPVGVQPLSDSQAAVVVIAASELAFAK